MRHKLFTTCFIVMLLAAAGVVAAQEPTAEPTGQESENTEAMAQEPETQSVEAEASMVVTGTAVNASPEEIVVKTEDGREVFLIDSEDIHPEPIEEGAPVTVWFVERGGHRYATKLEAGPGHAEADSSYATLPQTAGLEPLFALLGLIALGASALTLRRAQR